MVHAEVRQEHGCLDLVLVNEAGLLIQTLGEIFERDYVEMITQAINAFLEKGKASDVKDS
jgi:hypothetical protein